MRNFKDYDFIELEGEFLILPEDEFYEAIYWVKEITYNEDYVSNGILFKISDNEIIHDFSIDSDWFHYNRYEMDLLENDPNEIGYKRDIIEMIFEE